MIDVSILLGTVNRPVMVREAIEAARVACGDLSREFVVAYGSEDDPALPWLREQPDVRPIHGGMDGAIPAFNAAYAASKGRLVCQINDDVLPDGDSIALAAAHLDTCPCAGVVFKFDRGDGAGYQHLRLGGSLHPNQMVVRRETCEAVIEHIGAFWGDAAHRTDKTYGGDSAFGALCHHLGLRLDSVPGVTCRDRQNEANDALRARNQVLDPQHWPRWNARYKPLFQSPPVAPARDEWPHLYIPRPGMAPRRSPVDAGRPLRLLHVSAAYPGDMQEDLHAQLARIGPTVALPWHRRERQVIEAARAHRPDVVFAQIQSADWTDEHSAALRDAVGPACTLVLWTGDVRTSAEQPVDRWLVRAGHHFDLLLCDSTTYPRKLALDEKVPAACGYLQCGIDPTINPWEPDALEESGAVFMATNYTHLDGGARERLVMEIEQALPGVLTVYGSNWAKSPAASIARPFVGKQLDAARIMRRARVVVSVSLFHDLDRYTSDRLKRAMCAGAVVAVRRFPGMDGLGLVGGVNCLAWEATAELVEILREPHSAADMIRRNAAQLGHARFTQAVVVEELLAIVRDHRARRGLA